MDVSNSKEIPEHELNPGELQFRRSKGIAKDGVGRPHVTFDTVKEMQSPRFRAIMRATSGPKRRLRVDIKSFSHELNSKCPLHYHYRIQRAEDKIEKMKSKFNRLKDEVNSELEIFAGDLVGFLEKSENNHPNWREAVEDLLIIARECAEMSSDEFWSKCEIIVQNVDDRRQELQMGTLKQAHTRMLFILTRCTRLLQFQKDRALSEVEHVLGLHQFSDLGVYPGGVISHNVKNLIATKDMMLKDKSTQMLGQQNISPGSRDRISSWKKLPSHAEKNMRNNKEVNGDVSLEKRGYSTLKNKNGIGHDKKARNNQHAPNSPKKSDDSLDSSSTIQEFEHTQLDGELAMICRICDIRIPKAHVEEHSNICAVANKCDIKGLSINERLKRVAEVLQKILESWSLKSMEAASIVNDSSENSIANVVEPSYGFSQTQNNSYHPWYNIEVDYSPQNFESSNLNNVNMIPIIVCKREAQTSDSQSVASSSTGSHTPQSSSSTPRHTHVDFLITSNIFLDGENFKQIHDLLDIVHYVSSTNDDDYNSLNYLHSCLEDLQEIIQCKKVDALVVETFGRRIEKLLREKYTHILQQIDDGHIDPSSINMVNGDPLETELGHCSRPSPICSKLKDRTSIEDFEIIKPISRGAFGRVFLAKKRVTGDLFAIKVLKKTDMIRKNAVESILAERNILISVRNPFVVRFFYSFTCRENLYLVMEYLNGGDLYSLLRNLGCLDEDMARTYIAEVVLALEYLHSLNVIHRDLKPDNLLIAHDGHIKLTDFGLSKVGLINSTDDLSGPDLSNSALLGDQNPETQTSERVLKREQRQKQSVVGTPDYLAPEILLGMSHGPSADWWSVGIILYELLVGIPPFNAEHPQKIFDNIMNHNITWPSVPDEMSHEAYDLINRFLIENPLQRLGATGSAEVKRHPFFKCINWEMLAKQKAAFIPSTEGEDDTSYFTCRHTWNSAVRSPVNDYDDGTDSCGMSCDSTPRSYDLDEDGDECNSLADFTGGTSLSVKYSFSNFSFKNLSQLASMNYDLIMKSSSSSPPPANALKS